MAKGPSAVKGGSPNSISGGKSPVQMGYAAPQQGSALAGPGPVGGGGGSAAPNPALSQMLSQFSQSAGAGGGVSIPSARPGPTIANTAVNPLEQGAVDRWKNYESGLAEGTNQEITRELQRARDELSVGLEAEGEAATGRGADAGFFKSRRLEQGKRDIHGLQGRLADVALNRREGALTGLTGASGQAASGQRQLHLGEQAARLGEDRLEIDRAETQARLRDSAYDRQLRTLSTFSGILGNSGVSLLGY